MEIILFWKWKHIYFTFTHAYWCVLFDLDLINWPWQEWILHSLNSRPCPGQFFPLPQGMGLSHSLSLCWAPPPHTLSHRVHDDQPDQPPSVSHTVVGAIIKQQQIHRNMSKYMIFCCDMTFPLSSPRKVIIGEPPLRNQW